MIAFWIIFSFVVGFMGTSRNIGFWGAFLFSIFLSPLIGIIITLVSKDKEDEAYKRQIVKMQRIQSDTLNEIKNNKNDTPTMADELSKLKKLHADGIINYEELRMAKRKLFSV